MSFSIENILQKDNFKELNCNNYDTKSTIVHPTPLYPYNKMLYNNFDRNLEYVRYYNSYFHQLEQPDDLSEKLNNYSISLSSNFNHFTKRKGGHVRFSVKQTDLLEKRFNSHKYLSPEDRRQLAETLNLTDRQVKTWFQNRRAKWRRSHLSSGNNKNEIDKSSFNEICSSNFRFFEY